MWEKGFPACQHLFYMLGRKTLPLSLKNLEESLVVALLCWYKGLPFLHAFQMHMDHCIPVHLTGLGCSFQFFMERNPREA